jgi:hypothetical protein
MSYIGAVGEPKWTKTIYITDLFNSFNLIETSFNNNITDSIVSNFYTPIPSNLGDTFTSFNLIELTFGNNITDSVVYNINE